MPIAAPEYFYKYIKILVISSMPTSDQSSDRMMRARRAFVRSKLAALGLIIVCGAAAILGFANVLSFPRHAQAVPETVLGISPSTLHQQVDVKSLPTQLIADPI